MNHRIFERKLRPRLRLRACLPQRRFTPLTPLHWGVDLAPSGDWQFLVTLPGSAEVQRLEHGPRLQGNSLVGRHPPAPNLLLPEGTLLGAQQELGLALVTPNFSLRPELRQDYPLNLSISISGGKETNQDSLSNGE